MRSVMKSLLTALPFTMRPDLKIHNFTQSVELLASSRAHNVPMHSKFLRKAEFQAHLYYLL
ncbi:hypothetical protein CPR19079_NPKGKJFF_01981 [Companilactobacillus paralimentarius]